MAQSAEAHRELARRAVGDEAVVVLTLGKGEPAKPGAGESDASGDEAGCDDPGDVAVSQPQVEESPILITRIESSDLGRRS